MPVKWDGLDELRRQLKALPADLAHEARENVVEAAESAAAALRQAYPPGPTGRLRRGVKVTVKQTEATVVATLKSTAPEAHLWEWGTQVRRTQQGWNRGAAPAHYNQGVVGLGLRYRRRLNGQLVELVKRHGLEVTGA